MNIILEFYIILVVTQFSSSTEPINKMFIFLYIFSIFITEKEQLKSCLPFISVLCVILYLHWVKAELHSWCNILQRFS